eukprot:190671-Rhodomonas_salina.1
MLQAMTHAASQMLKAAMRCCARCRQICTETEKGGRKEVEGWKEVGGRRREEADAQTKRVHVCCWVPAGVHACVSSTVRVRTRVCVRVRACARAQPHLQREQRPVLRQNALFVHPQPAQHTPQHPEPRVRVAVLAHAVPHPYEQIRAAITSTLITTSEHCSARTRMEEREEEAWKDRGRGKDRGEGGGKQRPALQVFNGHGNMLGIDSHGGLLLLLELGARGQHSTRWRHTNCTAHVSITAAKGSTLPAEIEADL